MGDVTTRTAVGGAGRGGGGGDAGGGGGRTGGARADHLEAPIVAQDLGADIADVYFFLDPNDNNFAVLACTMHSFITPSENANAGFFDSTLRFRFAFENTGDAKQDYFIDVTHSKQTSRTVPQTASVVVGPKAGLLPKGREFKAPTTISRAAFGPQGPPTFGGGTSAQQTSTITTDAPTGISYFGGLIDDPFFFDLGAELAYRNSRFANQTNPAILTRGRDSFAGTNTLVVVPARPRRPAEGPGGQRRRHVLLRAAAGHDGLRPEEPRQGQDQRQVRQHRPHGHAGGEHGVHVVRQQEPLQPQHARARRGQRRRAGDRHRQRRCRRCRPTARASASSRASPSRTATTCA